MPDIGHNRRDGWTAGRIGCAIALGLAAVVAVRGAWLDILHIAWVDEESSQVWLVVPVMVMLLAVRRKALSRAEPASSFFGSLLVAVGWAMSWYGYFHAIQSVWHLGAVVLLVGAVWTALGSRVMLRAMPALVVAAFFAPVPGRIRAEIAVPMQEATAVAAEVVLVTFGQDVERTGMMLSFNGRPVVRIDEACNGMRMVFALLLVCYAYAMATPLKGYVRLLVIGLSPLLAVVSNIIRVVPTALVYAYAEKDTGDMVHDLSGWAMVFLAYGFLAAIFRVLEWAEVPVLRPSRPETDPAPSPPKPKPISKGAAAA